jgi:hypothetical protein
MNGDDGAMFESLADVRIENFKIADANIAGIEVALIDPAMVTGYARIDNAFVVGHSANANYITLGSN